MRVGGATFLAGAVAPGAKRLTRLSNNSRLRYFGQRSYRNISFYSSLRRNKTKLMMLESLTLKFGHATAVM